MFSLFAKKVATVVVPEKSAPIFVVPDKLPALQAKTGADLAQLGDFKAGANSPAPESLSPSQFLSSALNDKQQAAPATRAIARAMPENHAVQWAVDSSKTVSDKMSDPDRAALASAEKYLKEPSPSTQAAAAAAAAKTDFQGPGAFTAKAASLVGMAPVPPAAAAAGANVPPPANPVAECVAGAVMLAAVLSMGKSKPAAAPSTPATSPAASPSPVAAAATAPPPATPAETQELNKALKPLIEHGLQLATKM